MVAPARSAEFATANPHALASILEASQTRSIIAASDIFDNQGIKLWARDQPVSQALQRKLLDRQLRQPLESCLMAEDGVTSLTLVRSLEEQLAQDGPLQALLTPCAARLLLEAPYLPLHSVAQLLLTAGHAARPAAFTHAVQAMALNGALMVAHGGRSAEIRLAMLCGLLHDLGEMYIDPRYGEADADLSLDLKSYQQLVVHPHVGQLLLAQLTDYPQAVIRAVAEHHERLDGSGYPHCLQQDQVSPLGRMMAVTEATLGVLRAGNVDLARVSVALRVVPGEYDLDWVGQISKAARSRPAQSAAPRLVQIQARLSQLDDALAQADAAVAALLADTQAGGLRSAVQLAGHLLGRLRAGWSDSGLWSPHSVSENDAAEVEAIEDELLFRMRSIERAAQLRAGELPYSDALRLQQLCQQLSVMSQG